MTLLTIAELLAGEALISPGGPVDRQTAAGGDDLALWSIPSPAEAAAAETTPAEAGEEVLVTAGR